MTIFSRPLAFSIASFLCLSLPAWPAGSETSAPTSGVGEQTGSRKLTGPAVADWLATGSFTLGYQGSEHLNYGYMDSVTPLWRPGNAEVFLDTRSALDDERRSTGSYGLGFRYLFPKPGVIVGVNAFYDAIHSPYGNDFNQLGVGAEVLTKWVDARFNYYLPDHSLYEVDRSSSTTTNTDLGPLYFNGLLLQQNQTTTRRTRTISFAEGAMHGMDGEVGFLIPGLERYMQVRVFAGGYHFDNPVGRNYTGFKARLEARLLPGVTADVAYWEDAYLNGGQWTAGLRVSVPFSIGNLFTGRNPFEGFTDQFRPGQQQEFSKRMGEQVMRFPARTTNTGWDPDGRINGAMNGRGNNLSVAATTQTNTLGHITAFRPSNVTGTAASGTFSGGLLSVTTANGGTLTVPTSASGTISSGTLNVSSPAISGQPTAAAATASAGSPNATSGGSLSFTGGSGGTPANGASSLSSLTLVAQPTNVTGGSLTLGATGATFSSGVVINGASLDLGSSLGSGTIILNSGNLFTGNPALTTVNGVSGLSNLGTSTTTGSPTTALTGNFSGLTISTTPANTGAAISSGTFQGIISPNGIVNFPAYGTVRTIVLQGQTYNIPTSGGTLMLTNGAVTGGTLSSP